MGGVPERSVPEPFFDAVIGDAINGVRSWHSAMWSNQHVQGVGFHPERPGQSQTVGQGETHEVQSLLALGLWQLSLSMQTRGWKNRVQSCQKGLGFTDGYQAVLEPAVCPCSPENWPYPGLHQKRHGQHVEKGNPAPLPCAGETSPEVLHSDVESSLR